MQRKAILVAVVIISIVGLSSIYGYEYLKTYETKKITIDVYDIYATVYDNGTVNFRISIVSNDYKDKEINLNGISTYINDSLLRYTSSSLGLKNDPTYVIVNCTSTSKELIKAIEDGMKVDLKITLTLSGSGDLRYLGTYDRTLKFLFNIPGTREYYWTEFDFFGISG